VVSRFIYATRANVPDLIIKGDTIYRVVTDHLGSPRLILNATSGAVVEAIAYDEFGNVLTDSNPGFQPFGFAGGMYDSETSLLRFGARDYDPQTGRWTAKDPISFVGRDANLYTYCASDPVNLIDRDGNIAAAALLVGPAVAPPLGAAVVILGSGVAVGTAAYLTGQLIQDLRKTAAADELLRETIELNHTHESRTKQTKPCQPGRGQPRPNEKYNYQLPSPPPLKQEPDQPTELAVVKIIYDLLKSLGDYLDGSGN
jgi:RHS repeat-associated protein